MTTPEPSQETPQQRKKRLAAARQARFRDRKKAAGMAVGVIVRRDLLDAVTPRVLDALDHGRPLVAALNDHQIETYKLGMKVEKILLAADDGIKAAAKAATLRRFLDL